MREIAVVGAGELGGAVAHVLARRDIARSILLVDDDGRVASGKALDIAQAAPVEGFAAQIAGTSDIASAAGASAIIVADRVAGGQWSSEEGMLLIKRLVQSAPAAAIVCAADSSLPDWFTPPYRSTTMSSAAPDTLKCIMALAN